MIIIGAGLAGLIAANIMRAYKPQVWEAQKSLPSNHEALLRFRTTRVFDATGIIPTKVTVRKAIVYDSQFVDRPNIYMANMYSRKVLGQVQDRSIWNLEAEERYIAPVNLVEQLSAGLEIKYNQPWTGSATTEGLPIISTVPMPVLMMMTGWENSALPLSFPSLPIWSHSFTIKTPKVNVHQTIYYPDPDVPYYRASIVGDRVIIEFNSAVSEADRETSANDVLQDFGFHAGTFEVANEKPLKEHRLGKIGAIDEGVRRAFMYDMTRERNIYSLGRFATWRNILLDDLVNDCSVIKRLISQTGTHRLYGQALEAARAN